MSPPDLVPGAELEPLVIEPISRRTLALFAGASGDHQPVHLDSDVARARGYEDVFAPGMLAMAYLGRFLTERYPQSRIRSFRARFTAITPIHAGLTCAARVATVNDGRAHLELEVSLPDGTITVRGEATIDVR